MGEVTGCIPLDYSLINNAVNGDRHVVVEIPESAEDAVNRRQQTRSKVAPELVEGIVCGR